VTFFSRRVAYSIRFRLSCGTTVLDLPWVLYRSLRPTAIQQTALEMQLYHVKSDLLAPIAHDPQHPPVRYHRPLVLGSFDFTSPSVYSETLQQRDSAGSIRLYDVCSATFDSAVGRRTRSIKLDRRIPSARLTVNRAYNLLR
jgi:hypothetical protein